MHNYKTGVTFSALTYQDDFSTETNAHGITYLKKEELISQLAVCSVTKQSERFEC